MSKIKKLLGIDEAVKQRMESLQGKQTIIGDDLYGSIKEVAELKYRIIELEARLINLEAMVKILTKKEV